MNNIYIGIDASFTNTAVCILHHGVKRNNIQIRNETSFNFQDHENFYMFKGKINTGDTEAEILFNASKEIASLVEDSFNHFKTPKVHVAIEEPMGGNMGKGATVHRLYGAILVGLQVLLENQRNFTITTFKPSQIKKFATGKGNAKKEIMIKECYKKYGLEFNTNDEVDAFFIAKMLEEK